MRLEHIEEVVLFKGFTSNNEIADEDGFMRTENRIILGKPRGV